MAVCSTKALDPRDRAFYNAAAKNRPPGITVKQAQLEAVETLLYEATSDLVSRIQQIQQTYPRLIDNEGNFLGRHAAESTPLTIPTPAGAIQDVLPFDAPQEAVAKPKPVNKLKKPRRKASAKTENRLKKRSAAPVSREEQPGSTGETPAGATAADVAGQSTAPTAPKKGAGVQALRRGRARSRAPDQAAAESQPAGPQQAQQTQRQREQPPVVKKFSSAGQAWDALRRTVEGASIRTFRNLTSTPQGEAIAATWTEAFTEDRADATLLETLFETLDPIPSEDIENYIERVETATTDQDFIDAAKKIFQMAFFRHGQDFGGSGKRAERIAQGTEALLWGPEGNTALTEIAFLEAAKEELEAKIDPRTGVPAETDYVHAGKERPFAAFAMDKGLLLRLHQSLSTPARLPKDARHRITRALKDEGTKAVLEAIKVHPMSVEIANTISAVRKREAYVPSLPGISVDVQAEADFNIQVKLAGLKGAELEQVMSYDVLGAPLRDWLETKARGKITVRWAPANATGSRVHIVTPAGAEASVVERLLAMDTAPGDLSGKTFRMDGKAIRSPMSHGAVKVAVSRMAKRFQKRVGIEFRTYKNVADLQRRDRALYDAAVASQVEKVDIPDTSPGFSFNNKVLIFSSNVSTNQQLAFIMAHEALGHIGMRAVMPEVQFNRLVNEIYDASPAIRADAERRMDLFGFNKQDATEEALADLAAVIDTHIIVRVWNAIKTFLNKIGFEFQDDMARYLVHQSRRYVLDGQPGNLTAAALYQNLSNFEARGMAFTPTAEIAERSLLSRYTTVQPSVALGLDNPKATIEALASRAGLEKIASATGRHIGEALEKVQSLGNMGGRSLGLQNLFRIFQEQNEDVRQHQTKLESMTKFSHESNLLNRAASKDEVEGQPGSTKSERQNAGDALALAAMYKNPLVTKDVLKHAKLLWELDVNGEAVRNEEGIAEAKEFAHITREEFAAGIPQPMHNDNGMAIDEDGNPTEESGKEQAVELVKVKLTNREWAIMEEERAAVDEAALMVYFDKVAGVQASKQAELGHIQIDNTQITDRDMVVFNEVAEAYKTLYLEGSTLETEGLKTDPKAVDKAEKFMHEVSRAWFVPEKLKDWTDPNTKEDAGLFNSDPKFAHIKAKLQQIHDLKLNENKALGIGFTIRQLVLLDNQVVNAEIYAKKTIMSAYVPFSRKGKYQVQLKARLKGTNRPISLTEKQQNLLPYFRTNSWIQAQQTAEDLTNRVFVFAEGTKIMLTDSEGNNVEVELYADASEALQTPPLQEAQDYDVFVQTLVRLGVNLSPQERERVANALASHHSTARSNLMRTGTFGWDPNILGATAEHLERQTHIAGKNKHRWRVDEIMADRNGRFWFGDPVILTRLENKLAKAVTSKNDAAIWTARKALLEYQHILYHSSTDEVELTRNGVTTKRKGLGKGNRYRDVGKALIAFYNQNENIVDAAEEGLGKLAGPFMSITATFQLGMSVAAAAVNLGSLVTHAGPYLSTFNKKTGYGGGHGMGASFNAIYQAARDMNLFSNKLTTADSLGEIVAKKEWAKYGMKEDEARFVLEMAEKHISTPNLLNALIGTSRTGKQNNNLARLSRNWMFMFTHTEQFNRRVTGLASYRLEKERMIQSGEFTKEAFLDRTSEASAEVWRRAKLAVNTSQGEYAQYNRPAWARGPVFQFLFIYRQFQVITIELMRNLGPKERIAFLAMLWLLSGLKGMPFGEDLLNIIDTLAQKFGIKSAGIQAEASLLLEDMGLSSKVAFHGLLDYYLGSTMSTRFGQGNMIPLSGAFMAGADPGREIVNFLGPVASTVTAVVGTAALATRYAAEVLGIKEDATRASDILRKGAGITGVKSFTEAMIYLADGSVTNARGQVIAPEVGLQTVLYRLLGFYPGLATTHNEVVRMGKQAAAYATEIKTAYIDAYRKSDDTGRSRIKEAVRTWNDSLTDGRNNVFYIRDFNNAARIAVKEGVRSASARYLKAAPRATKPLTRELMSIYGFDSQGIPREEE